ncbi:MAG TPA: hypothetical protein VMQ58_02020 [Candidatus Saccharimonadales bacterium]|nr:hypothetical protein [Candidatus Saccharimonadales bacterium]
MEEKEKIIYTSRERTEKHFEIAENGYLEHYTVYNMFMRAFNKPKENTDSLAGMIRYSEYFYLVANDFFEDFEKEIGKENIERFKKIMNSNDKQYDDFRFIAFFIEMFGKKTGMRNISRDKDNINESVKKNR